MPLDPPYFLIYPPTLPAQQTPERGSPAASGSETFPSGDLPDEEIITLDPFEVTEEKFGYGATFTLSGAVHTPEGVSNVVFGGVKRNRLFMTASQLVGVGQEADGHGHRFTPVFGEHEFRPIGSLPRSSHRTEVRRHHVHRVAF